MNSRRQLSVSHLRRSSKETNASGISVAESLSNFPAPPSSIPSTPINSLPPSPRSTHFRRGAPPRPLPRPRPTDIGAPQSPAASVSSPYSREFSAHDWHEGASSIDVDATEDRLLSTSFITSLLQEPTQRRRMSIGSDAFSGFSEMTYPPGARYPDSPSDIPPVPSNSLVRPLPRPQGGRPLHAPTAFQSIPESRHHPTYSSDHAETLYEHEDEQDYEEPTVISAAHRQDATVVGIASGKLHNIPSDPRRSTVLGANHDAHGSSTALRPQSRHSHRSNRSVAPSFFSKVSSGVARVLPWKRKPLPPVPTLSHVDVAHERAVRAEEARMPLAHLAERADTLNGMLQKGYNPHNSLNSSTYENRRLTMTATGGYSKYTEAWQISSDPTSMSSHIPQPDANEKQTRRRFPLSRKRRNILIACIFIVLVAIGVGIGIGISQSHKSSEPDCAVGLAGATCTLNATCVCTSSVAGRCNGLARNIVDLTPTMNAIFETNHSLSGVYNSIWSAQGSPAGQDCSSQSNLVDVSAALSSDTSPNRTTWAQAALLWDLVQSQDTDATSSLKTFVASAPWSKIASTDGRVDDDSASFSISESGFIFDFANQSVSQPAVSFITNGQPSHEQISRVGDAALSALDRMYAFAFASSTQQQDVLSTYWTSVLSQQDDDLNVFLSLVASAPIILPFDATVTQDLMTSSTTDAFPPPLSCFPDLTDDQVEQIDSIETSVFAVPALTKSTQFDISCYPDRPIYGVIDLLRLRLPFPTVEDGTALQGVTLDRAVSPRVVIHSGAVLSHLPGADTSMGVANPREFGTLNHMNHVLLSYLSSMDTAVAIALITYVLSYKSTPPDEDSVIVQALSTIPILEVAVFGSVLPSDIASTVSSFSTTSGSLFFGSTASSVLRNWTITGQGVDVIWTENSTSATVAYDSSLTDQSFSEVFSAAQKAVLNDVADVSATNVTASLRSIGKMDP